MDLNNKFINNLKNNKFDLILVLDLIEHIENTDGLMSL